MRLWFAVLALVLMGLAGYSTLAQAGSTYKPGEVFHECAGCPEMVVIPAGSFMMGALPNQPDSYEGAQRQITLPKAFAAGRYAVTRAQYEAFVRATNRPPAKLCYSDFVSHDVWAPQDGLTWENPGFPQGPDHPAVCVSWDDAEAYVQWLNTKTPGGYRLLSEAEWEYAARAGTTTPFIWGTDPNQHCAYANGQDLTVHEKNPTWVTSTCSDGAYYTAPVGSYKPNAFGLYDMFGNVWQWGQDCFVTGGLSVVHADGSPNEPAACSMRVNRGGGWADPPTRFRPTFRGRNLPYAGYTEMGFRVAKTLP
jgi:formylglycine-generating enzyme required for sulfatase activity